MNETATQFSVHALVWLADSLRCDARKLELVRLKGATSSSVYRADIAGTPTAVLRVLDNDEWLAREPDLAAHESAALTFACSRGLRAPRALAHAANATGFGAPVVLMSFMAGNVQLNPGDRGRWLRNLADELALIHSHTAAGFPWRYRSWTDRPALAVPAWSRQPQTWQAAIDVVRGAAPDFVPVFLHRDYHPTNVLWRDGAVSGVVDWINACTGPAGVDVAHCRANLAVMIGARAADEFLAAYQRAAPGFAYAPFWDLDSVLDACFAPRFYSPWREFGLAEIPELVIKARAEEYLHTIIRRL